MLTEFNLINIFDILTSDESFCRFVCYGDNPLGEDKEDITAKIDYRKYLKDNFIYFSPQIENLTEQESVRICIFKNYSKLSNLESAIRYETIQFDIYVPHRLQRLDMRVYKLENRISSLLDKRPLNMGYLDYTDGNSVPMPPIIGYTLYRMTFKMEEGRPPYGKL